MISNSVDLEADRRTPSTARANSFQVSVKRLSIGGSSNTALSITETAIFSKFFDRFSPFARLFAFLFAVRFGVGFLFFACVALAAFDLFILVSVILIDQLLSFG